MAEFSQRWNELRSIGGWAITKRCGGARSDGVAVSLHPARSFASAMSAADNAALTLAVQYQAEFLLFDERITRRMAEAEGIRPMGTLGVLLRAMRNDLLDQIETRRLVDLLVISHGFRIGVGLYQAVLAEIQKG